MYSFLLGWFCISTPGASDPESFLDRQQQQHQAHFRDFFVFSGLRSAPNDYKDFSAIRTYFGAIHLGLRLDCFGVKHTSTPRFYFE